MSEPTPSTEAAAAYLAGAAKRAADERTAMGLAPDDTPASADDVPRLVAALEAVLGAHRNADGRCAWCREPTGERSKWPCGEYLAIKAELLGEGSG